MPADKTAAQAPEKLAVASGVVAEYDAANEIHGDGQDQESSKEKTREQREFVDDLVLQAAAPGRKGAYGL